MGTIHVHEADARDLDDMVAVRNAVDAVSHPSDPPIDGVELGLEIFQTRATKPMRGFLARVGGKPAGMVLCELPSDANVADVEMYAIVDPAYRRQGVGRALVAHALAAMPAERTRVSAWADAGEGEAFAQSLGLTPRQEVRQSRLAVDDLDLAQQQRWIDDAPARSLGYQVVCWHGPYPAEHLDAVCEALTFMADAPLDDFEHEHVAVVPERVREGEASVRGRIDQFGAVALAPDGSAAGFTELGVKIHRPQLGDQGDTVVVAAHRGHGLGRWLKAANLRCALAAHPELVSINTYNAESNRPMLDINEPMGFRPYKSFIAHQGPRATVEVPRGPS